MADVLPSSHCSRESIREAADAIQAYWGAHLYIRVTPDVTPCMDWKQVLLPDSFVKWSEDQLTATLLHEWGHRMISPVSPQLGAIWRKVAEKSGLGESQAALAVNIVTDAWVDRANLENTTWGSTYHSGNVESIAGLESRLDAAGDESDTSPMHPFMRLWAAFNRRLLVEVGPLDTAPPDRLSFSGEERAAVDELWGILFQDGLTKDERVKRAARWLRDWLPEEEEVSSRFYPMFHPFSGRERGSDGLTERVRIQARRAGLDDSDLNDIFGKKEVEKLRLKTTRLRMYSRVVPAVEKFLAYRRRKAFEGYSPWRPGGHLQDLDVVATLERSSTIIPGVTTLERHYERRGHHPGRGSGGVILVIDDSGSTDGNVLLREKEAAFAVIAAARQFGDPVGCVVFGSEVTKALPPSSQYDALEETICLLSSDSGGTAMEPALREALHLTHGHAGFTTMIMTDADIADGDEVRQVILTFPLESKLIAFCFNTVDAVRESLGSMASRIRLLSVSPDVPFVEAALEEIYG